MLLNSLLEKGMPELFSGDTIGSVSILFMNRSNFNVIGNLLPGPAIFDLSSILEFYNSLLGMTESIFFYGMSYLTNSANALSCISSRSAF